MTQLYIIIIIIIIFAQQLFNYATVVRTEL